MAMAPTCLTCGSILMGYGWDKEMNFPVYFCTQCSVPEKAVPRAEVGEKEAA